MHKLFLFDLDGTILKVKTPSMVSIVDRSLKDNGLEHKTLIEKKFAGRTDHDIFNSYLDASSNHLYDSLKNRYIDLMLTELTESDVDLIDGVHTVCDWLTTNQIDWGLLTGNYEISGKQKVKCSRFPLSVSFGVFGDHHTSRTELASQALALGKSYFQKEYNERDIIIIGDTPKDIICAKENGYIAVAVATGGYTFDELEAFNPDFTIHNLSELPQLFS